MIDGLGGVYIDVDSEEIKHINNYQIGIAEVLKCDYTPVTETGVQLLNGSGGDGLLPYPLYRR